MKKILYCHSRDLPAGRQVFLSGIQEIEIVYVPSSLIERVLDFVILRRYRGEIFSYMQTSRISPLALNDT